MVSAVLAKMIAYFGDDVRRINHSLKVYGFAKTIAGGEALLEKRRLTVELAAILHDIGIPEAVRKYNSSAGKYQEIEGPPIAAGMLGETGVGESISQRVCFLVGHHHSYGQINDLDFQILVEADFIVNIDEGNVPEFGPVKNIRDKYFKTVTGLKILDGMFGAGAH
ncbi:MAG: HD domain-containing protein [Bacillota bacterium]